MLRNGVGGKSGKSVHRAMMIFLQVDTGEPEVFTQSGQYGQGGVVLTLE